MKLLSASSRGTAVVILVLVAGCAAGPDSASIDTAQLNTAQGPAPLEKMIEEVQGEMAAHDEVVVSSSPGATEREPEIALELNANVQRWIEFFTQRDRIRFERFLARGQAYREMIETTLAQYNVPKELYFLALIESGFQTHATSRASAVGIWQFIRPTGVRYGLAVNSYVDERIDPVRSTVAAALYLGDLHNVFNSWYLAMASYNAGEARIMGAIMRQNSRNFWELVKARALPRETMEYIPKFIAATIIGKHPESFGFPAVANDETSRLVAVEVAPAVAFRDIERITGVTLATLKRYNPALKRAMTPPGGEPYRILVPETDAAAFADKGAALAAAKSKTTPELTATEVTGDLPKTHRVRRGETLASIADRYQLSLSQLRHMNRLRSSHVKKGQVLRLSVTQVADRSSPFHYRVRRGDSLKTISARFGVPITTLKELNSLRRNKIYAGEVLKIASNQG